MAISLELGIGNLIAEFLADALVLLCTLQAAGAISAGTLQTVFDHLNHFLIFIQSDGHNITSSPLPL